MTDSTKSTIEQVDVIDISLDAANVRLRDVEPYEADILAYLYDNESAYELANDIALAGFFAHDLPIVTRENGKLIVLEGNRRIAALRGLSNPSSVPKYASKLEALRRSMSPEQLDALTTINVSVAPSREAAQLTIASIHTRTPKKSWPLDQQAKFFHSQLSPGRTVADLQRDFPTVAANIPDAIRMGEMYELVKAADLGSQDLHEFVESKEFKLSIFERLYQSQRFRELLGIEFSPGGLLQVHGDQALLNRVLAYVVQDMRSGFLTTRRLGRQTQPEFVRYLDELEKIAHVGNHHVSSTDFISEAGSSDAQETTDRDAGSVDLALSGSQSSGASNSAKDALESPLSKNSSGEKKAESKRPSDKLDSRGISFNLYSPGTERRYSELISLNYKRFPNATMDQIRTVLECALKAYFIAVGDPIPRRRPQDLVTMRDALAHALKHFNDDNALRPIIAHLKTENPINEQQYTKSAQAMNAANHNPDTVFNSADVQDAWLHVRPLLQVLLGYTPEQVSKS